MTDRMQRIYSGNANGDALPAGVARLKDWRCGYLVERALNSIPHGRLIKSTLHGTPHVERVVLLGAMCAFTLDTDDRETWLALMGCAYHDVGRVEDGNDYLHGLRGALMLPKITELDGEELRIVQTAVAAHSHMRLRDALTDFAPEDTELAAFIARIVRDADRLDFVRLGGVDKKFLQFGSSRALVPFAYELLEEYFRI